MMITGRTRMSIIHLVYEVIEVSIKVIIGLGWKQTISGGAFDGVGKALTSYCVELICWICARMSIVEA
jgi:hypothetical protein